MKALTQEQLDGVLREMDVEDVSRTTIRHCSAIAAELEKIAGEKYTHLEIGVPGLPACPIGVEAQKKALDSGEASIYPPIYGVPELKENGSKFVKAFLNTDISPKGIIPTTGSMQGAFTMALQCGQLDPKKDTILFLCPGFPPHGRQPDVIGTKQVWFDLYKYRGEKLREKMESYMAEGNIFAILYSNPNNPTWVCLTEDELKTIGELATKYDAIVIEDLAYLCMDFREDLSKPFEPPYQPTVSHYTDNYVLLISGSKIFSYAGERIAIACISDKLYKRDYPELRRRYNIGCFGECFALIFMYISSSGTSHSAQCALGEMFAAACDGRYNFVREMREYGLRSKRSRDIFFKHGFHLVYDRDGDSPLSDGFFYTIEYKNLTNRQMMEGFLRCGLVAIALNTTGSDQDGLRICVSRLNTEEDFRKLDEHLALFTSIFN